MSDPLVWLPFEPGVLGDPPAGLSYEVVDPSQHVPATVSEVEVYVTPYVFDVRASEVLEQMSSVRVVQTLTAGVEHIRSHVPDGVLLCNGRGIHETSAAELALTLILASLRGIPDIVRRQDQRRWHYEWRPALADKRVLDRGLRLDRRGDRTPPRAVRDRGRAGRTRCPGRRARDLRAVRSAPGRRRRRARVPLTDETRGLVDAEFLARMKDGALLVNVARGQIVVNADLVAALESGRITAAVDVVDPEPLPEDSALWSAPGLLISPHVGGASSAMWPRAYRLVRDQLHRIARGEEPVNIMTGLY